MDKKKKKKISPEKSNNNIDLISLIISQDPIEGYWEKNKDTINVEKLVTKNIINNLKKICLKKKENIYYNILIIYFISTKFSEKYEEYKLILNKAKNYLKRNNIIYEKIISQI